MMGSARVVFFSWGLMFWKQRLGFWVPFSSSESNPTVYPQKSTQQLHTSTNSIVLLDLTPTISTKSTTQLANEEKETTYSRTELDENPSTFDLPTGFLLSLLLFVGTNRRGR